MGLDILSEKGQASLHYEKIMLDKISEIRGVDLVETDKDTDAKIDGLIIKNNVLVGAFESKCRKLSLDELKRFGSWLITMDKILDGRKVSKLLRIPFFGFLYLIRDERILCWQITDSEGTFSFDFNIANTKTQKTINGGEIVRTNAFLPIEKARIIQ